MKISRHIVTQLYQIFPQRFSVGIDVWRLVLENVDENLSSYSNTTVSDFPVTTSSITQLVLVDDKTHALIG